MPHILFPILFALFLFDANSVYASASEKLSSGIDQLTLIQAVKQSTELNDSERNQLLLQLEQANSWAKARKQVEQETQALKEIISQEKSHSAKRLAELKELEQQQNKINNLSAQTVHNQQLIADTQKFESALNISSNNFLKWDAQLSSFQKLATEGAQQKSSIQKNLNQLNAFIDSSKTGAELSLAEQAGKLSTTTRKQLLTAQLNKLHLQLDRLELFTRFAQTERDYWFESKTILTEIVSHLQNIEQEQKATVAEQELQKITEQEYTVNSPLYEIQQRLLEVQRKKAELIKQEKRIQNDINQLNELVSLTKANYARDQQIVSLRDSQETIARVLHKRLESISKTSIKDSDILHIQETLNNAVLNQLLLSEQIREQQQGNIEQQLSQLIVALPEDEQAETKKTGAELHMQYLHSAKELQSLYPGFVSKISELNSVYLKQKEQHNEYRQFLNNHLLWLPNAERESLVSLEALDKSLQQTFAGEDLSQFYADTKLVPELRPYALTVWILIIAGLIYARQHFILQLEKLASKIASVRTDSMMHSLKALLLTFALAAPLPLIIFACYDLLNAISSPSLVTERLNNGLLNGALLALILSGLQQACRPKGLVEKHFRWNSAICHVLYSEMKWAIPFGTLVTIFIGVNTDVLSPSDQQILGRIAFIALMLGLLVLLYRLWAPNRVIINIAKTASHPPTWLQMHFIWFSLIMLIPISLIWSTISGYYYSSILIAERFNLTVGLILAAYFLREMLLRGIYFSERKQRFEERLKQLQAENQTSSEKEPNNPDEAANIEDSEINYEKLNKQVKQTINLGYLFALAVGLWVLWDDVLLALNLIDDTALTLTKSQVVDGVIQQVPLTLSDLIQGITLGVITLLLAKNLPGILEYTVLKFLPITPAVRYAVSSLTQYLIAIIGFVMIFRALGIEWSNIQWLVAALSVGLGFGLQEIVANFVSGIILLFEQPIRVGDTVTVGDTTGKVTKIRIRATTIESWERQELVIPNKEIITGQLINWSLSDPISRIRVDIGIAYGSDVNKAMQLMLDAAKEHPQILKDPEPSVIFDSFGDNALLLTLRAFVDNLENRIITKSELNSIVNDKMNDAGIVIAFPQRDIHLDTSSPLEIRMTKENTKSAS